MMKLTFLVLLLLAYVYGKSVVKNTAPTKKATDAVETDEADKRILMPGTKWCGMGNKAENDDDLGTYVDLDMCCRSHDKCKRKVDAFSKAYDYRNWYPFTVNDCECDGKFFSCMKDVKDHPRAAGIVGNLFFNILSMPCLEFNAAGTKATKGSSPSF